MVEPTKKTRFLRFFGGGAEGFSGGPKGIFVRTLWMEQRMEGCDEPRSTTFQTVVALPVDVVIPGGTASEQLYMPTGSLLQRLYGLLAEATLRPVAFMVCAVLKMMP